jgi:hypothetical protein
MHTINNPKAAQHLSANEIAMRSAADKLLTLLSQEGGWECLDFDELSKKFTIKELSVLSEKFSRALNEKIDQM